MSEPTAAPSSRVVSVIGGAGHVGLPLCLVAASAGHTVYGIDINAEVNAQIMQGHLPFLEEGGPEKLREVLSTGRLTMLSDISKARECDVVVMVLGTPVDENLNPRLAHLKRALRDLLPHLRENQLMVLRSTISPGTTELFREIIEKETPLRVGQNFFLVFAPERIAQGKAIREIVELPQLIGAFDDRSYAVAESFFSTFVKNRCLRLTPTEAEIGKLITNMYRYVQFALANECFLIAESFNVNAHRIIDACNFEYPRVNLPTPGPNVGGPCLYKDGFFLLEHIPFQEIISAAFKINEGMPMQIVQKIRQHPEARRIAILGLTFKGDSDDTRNSLSFKLKKQLEAHDYELVMVDPYVPAAQPLEAIRGCDCVVLMTPHAAFRDLGAIVRTVANPECLFADLWGFWSEMRGRSANGWFRSREVASCESSSPAVKAP